METDFFPKNKIYIARCSLYSIAKSESRVIQAFYFLEPEFITLCEWYNILLQLLRYYILDSFLVYKSDIAQKKLVCSPFIIIRGIMCNIGGTEYGYNKCAINQ